MNATLFHLHFNTPDVDGAAERLADAGVPLQRRFGSVRGEGVSLDPGEPEPDGFRFKLQVHQRGRANVTLAAGRRPRLDHLGLIVDDFEAALDRAASLEWSIRRNERRTFAMTPWRFRIEVHPADGEVVAELGDPDVARITRTALRLPDPEATREGFDEAFGGVPELRIEEGEGPWVASFDLVTEGSTRTVDVTELLGGRNGTA